MLSVVIPAYNEQATLPQVLEKLAVAGSQISLAYEVIVVDDGSTDGTWHILKRLAGTAAWQEQLRGVRLSRNFGKEAAIVAGLQRAGGDAVIVMDADLQHPPELIPRMVELWATGDYLVVEAVKRQRQSEPFLRRLSALYFYRLLLLGAGLDLRNSTDFKLLDRRAVDAYLDLPETRRFFRGLTAWLGLPTARLDVAIPVREGGSSKWRLKTLIDLARGTLVAFSALPLRLISWIGVFGIVWSAVLIGQTLWNKWYGGSEAGFPTVIILVLGMGSLILLSLGILGEYLSEIYNEIKRRPLYVVRETLASSHPGGEVEQKGDNAPAARVARP
jgi:glycosyltransferase involved in cell wall biosynthesis